MSISVLADRFAKSGILMLWGSVMCYFYFSGRIVAYLHPGFHWLTLFAGGLLVTMAFLTLLLPRSEEDAVVACGPTTAGPWILRILAAVILIVPLLIAVRMSPSQFGATTVMNRGFISSVSQLPYVVNMPDEPLPGVSLGDMEGGIMDYLPRNEQGQIVTEAIDLLYAVEEPTIRADFEGREIEMIGQYMPAKQNNAGGNRFNLVRLFMLCCAADAQPMAVLVQPEAMEPFPDMTWVKVTGRAVFPVEGGGRIPLVENAHVEETEAPRDIFVY